MYLGVGRGTLGSVRILYRGKEGHSKPIISVP